MSQIDVLTLFNSLSTFGATVTGVKNSYAISAVPDKLSEPQIPALIIYPGVARGDLFHFQTFMAGAPHMVFSVVHQLYYAPSDSTKYRSIMPGLFAVLMDYVRKAQAQGFLDTRDTSDGSKAWQVPMNFTPTLGPAFPFADVNYHGIQFTYNFDIQL